jgi:hypothetical protein
MLTASQITIIVAVLLIASLATPAIVALTTSPTVSPTISPSSSTMPPTTFPTISSTFRPINIGSTVKCSNETTGNVYRYVGQNTLRHYPNDVILHSYKDAVVPTEIDCKGMVKGADMVYSIPTNSIFRCKMNPPKGCLNKTLYSAHDGDVNVMCLDSDSAPHNAKSLVDDLAAFGNIDCLGFVVNNPTK